MTLDDYIYSLDYSPVRRETIDGKDYLYYEDGSYDVYESTIDGKFTVTTYENDICTQICEGDINGNYQTRTIDGTLINEKIMESQDVYQIKKYTPEGYLKSVFDSNGDYKNYTSYDYYSNGNLKSSYSGTTKTLYEYYDDNTLYRKRVLEALDESTTTTTIIPAIDFGYTKNPEKMIEERVVGELLESRKEYEDGKLVVLKEYKYYDNGNISKCFKTENFGNGEMVGQTYYHYDEDGNLEVTSDFYLNDKLVIHLTDNRDSIGAVQNDDGSYSFYVDGDRMFLEIDKDGKRAYYGYNDDSDTSYSLILDDNEEFYLFSNDDTNKKSTNGTFKIDRNGHIICLDRNGNTYEYDSFGTLIKKEEDGVVYEYNSRLNSQKISKPNGKVSYSKINHIEYDEETYENIMKNMISICDEYPTIINNSCNNCEEVINSFSDKFASGSISSINNDVQNCITTINDVKESINYSLLAYSSCDKTMEKKTHDLIDSLFDVSEKLLANAFKNNINKYIHDADNDQILDYKSDTNFNHIYSSILPFGKETDKDGNTWYYNLNNQVVSVVGPNPKIRYGNEEFRIEMTDSGLLKLFDSNNNPITIFADYNIPSGQYGGDQGIFEGCDLDNNINCENVINEFFPNATPEEVSAYYSKVAETGCGYIALTNLLFQDFEGKEEDFYKTFGFQMYNITRTVEGLKVDFNYEPIALELYSVNNSAANSLANTAAIGDGTTVVEAYKMFKYLQNKYHVYDVNYNEYMETHNIFADIGYNLYYMNGELCTSSGGPHAMIKICEIEEGKWLVSTYGQKMICEVCAPYNFVISEENMKKWGLD